MITITNLEKLKRIIANFPSRASDVRFQQELYDEIFTVLNNLNHTKASARAVTDLRKEIEALKQAPHQRETP